MSVLFLGCGAFFHPRIPARVTCFAFAVCAADAVSIVPRSPWLEWVAAPLLPAFVAQVSHVTRRAVSKGTAHQQR